MADDILMTGSTVTTRVSLTSGTLALNDVTYACGQGKGPAINLDASGGVISVSGNEVVFSGNSNSGSYGGGIYAKQTGGSKNTCSINVSNIAFVNNYAKATGGGIHISGATATFSNSTFSGNGAGQKGGGAIYNEGSTGNINLEGGTFTGNYAGQGGAIYVGASAKIYMSGNIVFSGNTATNGATKGGAIYATKCTVTFSGSVDLATESDTWVNEATAKTYAVTTIWDLTGGTASYGTIKNFERFSNVGNYSSYNKQVLLLHATKAQGDYVIATGDLSDLTNKDTFYISTNSSYKDTITVGTLGYLYNKKYYCSLTKSDSALTLSVTSTNESYTTTQVLGGMDGKVVGGTYDRMVLGGELQAGNHEYTGSYTLTVSEGTFNSDVAGGDAANAYVTRTGDVTVNVSGGTFNKSLSAGSYYATEGSVLGQAAISGSATLNISGGTFTGRIYGGNGAMTDALGACTVLQGSTNITINANATSPIYIGECIAAGSRGHGIVSGSTNVTIKGSGNYLTFGDDSVLFGGCSGDYYKVVGGVRTTADTQVLGTRNLTFDGFEGSFGAEIRMFSDISFVNNTSVAFDDDDLDLKEVSVWNFDCSSCATSLNKNKFAGDTINIDTSNYDGEWTLLQGSEEALADLGSALLVTLGGETATWNDSACAWCTAEYQLWVEEEQELRISELA